VFSACCLGQQSDFACIFCFYILTNISMFRSTHQTYKQHECLELKIRAANLEYFIVLKFECTQTKMAYIRKKKSENTYIRLVLVPLMFSDPCTTLQQA
jgi:hypothetical protein